MPATRSRRSRRGAAAGVVRGRDPGLYIDEVVVRASPARHRRAPVAADAGRVGGGPCGDGYYAYAVDAPGGATVGTRTVSTLGMHTAGRRTARASPTCAISPLATCRAPTPPLAGCGCWEAGDDAAAAEAAEAPLPPSPATPGPRDAGGDAGGRGAPPTIAVTPAGDATAVSTLGMHTAGRRRRTPLPLPLAADGCCGYGAGDACGEARDAAPDAAAEEPRRPFRRRATPSAGVSPYEAPGSGRYETGGGFGRRHRIACDGNDRGGDDRYGPVGPYGGSSIATKSCQDQLLISRQVGESLESSDPERFGGRVGCDADYEILASLHSDNTSDYLNDHDHDHGRHHGNKLARMGQSLRNLGLGRQRSRSVPRYRRSARSPTTPTAAGGPASPTESAPAGPWRPKAGRSPAASPAAVPPPPLPSLLPPNGTDLSPTPLRGESPTDRLLRALHCSRLPWTVPPEPSSRAPLWGAKASRGRWCPPLRLGAPLTRVKQRLAEGARSTSHESDVHKRRS